MKIIIIITLLFLINSTIIYSKPKKPKGIRCILGYLYYDFRPEMPALPVLTSQGNMISCKKDTD